MAPRDEVTAAAATSFPNEDAAAVVAILDEYGIEPHERDREIVQLAILKLSANDVDKLLYWTDIAKRDWRDVILFASHPTPPQ